MLLHKTSKMENLIKNLAGKNHMLLLMPLVILLTFIACSQPAGEQGEQKDPTLTSAIDDLVERIQEGEDINQVDRNKIYDLAHYLNNKYKGGMESDEIIEVIE